MPDTIESMGENAESMVDVVRRQNFEHFQAFLLPESGVQHEPEFLAMRQQMEHEQRGIQSSAQRLDLLLSMPGNHAIKKQAIEQQWGRLTQNGQINENVKAEDYVRYGDVIIGRLQSIYNPEALEQLHEIAQNSTGEDDSIIDAIANNTDGKGYGLELPEMSPDMAGFFQNVQNNRYLVADTQTGIIRPHIQQINEDIERLRALPLNAEAGPFIRFLEDLQRADPELHYHHVIVPRIRSENENPRLADAAGSLRMIFFLGLAAMGTISLIMERNKNFPTVAALYLGAAAFVLNPKMFSDGPTEMLASSLNFTAPQPGGDDKWADLMEGDLSSEFTGDAGVQIFTALLEPITQTYNKQVAEQKITPEQYFANLGEQGLSAEEVESMKKLHNQQPEVFFYLLMNLPRVRTPQAKDLLLSYVEQGMTASKANHAIATAQ